MTQDTDQETTQGCQCAQCRRDEPIDECTRCGQSTMYRCTRVMGERVCEGCYTEISELM